MNTKHISSKPLGIFNATPKEAQRRLCAILEEYPYLMRKATDLLLAAGSWHERYRPLNLPVTLSNSLVLALLDPACTQAVRNGIAELYETLLPSEVA